MTDKELFGNVQATLIYMTKHGSHAYGTSTPSSDLDMRGVCIPHEKYLLGFTDTFEQIVKHNPDVSVFSLPKFFRLAADCNPNVLEILYTEEEDQVYLTEAGRELLSIRDMFLSKKAKHTFSGYAMSQLKRIKSHREWLLHPPKAAPIRADFGLPERTVIPGDQLDTAQALIRKQVEAWDLDLEPLDEASKIQFKEKLDAMLTEMKLATEDERFLAAGRKLGVSDNFLEVLDKERRYNSAQREWHQYQEWLKTRNKDRAELERKYGYDCKHGMHLVRLMRMCREILADGVVLVRRPDREELLEIRNGGWSYDKLIEWAEAQDEELNKLYQTSKLPHNPPRDKLNQICINLIKSSI